MAVVLLFLAVALVPFRGATAAPILEERDRLDDIAPNSGEAATRTVVAPPRIESAPSPPNLISDGTFDAIPGPWSYSNGTAGVVSAERDVSARARLGTATTAAQFDSMDDVFGPNLWVNVTSGPGDAIINLTQESVIRQEGTGSMRADVTILQNGNKWAGAVRDDALPWNWSGYDRVTIRVNKATPGFAWMWVYIEDGSGGTSWGFYTLVSGWYPYAVDLNASLDSSNVNFIMLSFSSDVGALSTVYVDDIVVLKSAAFDETASVSQTFTKSSPTGGSPNTLRLTFDLEAAPSGSVDSYLGVAIDGGAEWSENPVGAGARTVYVDLSDNVALQGTGSFTLTFSLRINFTGFGASSLNVWIDNVLLTTVGTLNRIVVTPSPVVVPVAQTALLTAEGRDAFGNPVPLTATNWSTTIGEVVSVNATAATFRAPPLPGTGVVSAVHGNVTGTVNVTVDPWGTPRINGIVPDQLAGEDAAAWVVDLTPYATNQTDPADTLDNLKWDVAEANETLYTVFGVGTFGRHSLVFTPLPDASGIDDAILWLEDRDGVSTGQSLRVEITPVDDPPFFIAVPEIPVAYNEAYTFDFFPYVRDIDTLAANLTLTTEDPDHITTSGLAATYLYGMNFNGRILFVHHYLSDGPNAAVAVVEIRVSDNHPPRVTQPLPDLSFPEDTVLRDVFPESLRTYFDDRDGDQLFLSYGFTNLLVWINDTGTKVTVDVTGLANYFGEERITFRGTDSRGAYAEITVRVNVIAVNDPPVVAWTGDVYVRFDQPYRLDLSPFVSDVDNATADLLLTTNDPVGADVGGLAVTFLYLRARLGPDPQYVVSIDLSLSDGIATTVQKIDVHVSDNRPPELVVPLDDLTFNEDKVQADVIFLGRHFVDADGDKLSYSGTGRNVSVDIARDKVTLVPDPDWFGQEVLVFRAEDPSGAFALGYVLVNVLSVNDAPVLSPMPTQIRSEGGSWILDLRPYVRDVDTDLSQLTFSTNSPFVEAAGFLLVFNYPDSAVDTEIVVTVSDGSLTDSAAVVVRIVTSPSRDPGPWPWLVLGALVAAGLVAWRYAGILRFRLEDVFLVTRGGLLVAHATRHPRRRDEDILAGMLTAIMDFAQESFGDEGQGLKRFEIGERDVALERSEHGYAALVGWGDVPPRVGASLRNFLDDVEERYGTRLARWSGLLSDVPGVTAMTELFIRRGQYRRGDWKRLVLSETAAAGPPADPAPGTESARVPPQTPGTP